MQIMGPALGILDPTDVIIVVRPGRPGLVISKMLSYRRKILRVIWTVFESVKIRYRVIPWTYILVTSIMVLDKLLKLGPVTTLAFLSITRSKPLKAIRWDPTQVIIGRTHRLTTNSIEAMEDMGIRGALRFILPVFLE